MRSRGAGALAGSRLANSIESPPRKREDGSPLTAHHGPAISSEATVTPFDSLVISVAATDVQSTKLFGGRPGNVSSSTPPAERVERHRGAADPVAAAPPAPRPDRLETTHAVRPARQAWRPANILVFDRSERRKIGPGYRLDLRCAICKSKDNTRRQIIFFGFFWTSSRPDLGSSCGIRLRFAGTVPQLLLLSFTRRVKITVPQYTPQSPPKSPRCMCAGL